MNTLKNTRTLVNAATIAGIYAILSLAFAPMTYGLVQIRVSEALTVLPRYSKNSIMGLFVGCVVANLIGTMLGLTTAIDVLLGSCATLFAAIASYKLRRHKWLVPIPPIVINALVVGFQLCYIFNVGAPLWACIGYVAIGQIISCYIFGGVIMYAIDKIGPSKIGLITDGEY